MVHLLLAADGPTAMRLGGALLGDERIELAVVSDGRSLLDRLNAAPHLYHLVVLAWDLPAISGPECLAVIRRLHERMPVLVLADDLDEARLRELAALGVRRAGILAPSDGPSAFAAAVRAAIAGLDPPGSGRL